MTKEYLIKFKEGVAHLKKEAILNGNQVVQCLESFGIYIILLNDEIMYSLRKDEDVLYVKEAKKEAGR